MEKNKKKSIGKSIGKNIDKNLLQSLGVAAYTSREEIQTLWQGYGVIERIELTELTGQQNRTAILKRIRIAPSSKATNNTSHKRKLKSYRVEMEWYKSYSHLCNSSCRVPAFLGAVETEDTLLIVLQDLDAEGFYLRRESANTRELEACIFWLANFHATFMNHRPQGLWPVGTYWHLATRSQELKRMPRGRLKSKAHQFDHKLNNAQYQTLVHGDAKPANFCFSPDGAVAAVDFQYVGRGCGIKDLVYLLWGESSRHESTLVEIYFEHLQAAVKTSCPDIDHGSLKKEWRDLYQVAQDDFRRFLQGWLLCQK